MCSNQRVDLCNVRSGGTFAMNQGFWLLSGGIALIDAGDFTQAFECGVPARSGLGRLRLTQRQVRAELAFVPAERSTVGLT